MQVNTEKTVSILFLWNSLYILQFTRQKKWLVSLSYVPFLSVAILDCFHKWVSEWLLFKNLRLLVYVIVGFKNIM